MLSLTAISVLLGFSLAAPNPTELQKSGTSNNLHTIKSFLIIPIATDPLTKPAPACVDAKPIVANGNFETGSLAPWLVLFSAPNLLDAAGAFSYNVTSPGYISKYAFTMTDKLASPFVEVDIGQIEVPVCVGRKYKLSAKVFITDGGKVARKDQLLQLYVDNALVAQAPEGYIKGPLVAWRSLEGTFTAMAATVTVQVTFRITKLVDARWGVDDVVITPV